MSNAPRRSHGPGGPGGPGPVVSEKPKNFKNAAKQFISFCRPYGTEMIIAFFLAVLGAVCTIIGPSKIQDITGIILEGIVKGIDIDAVVKIGVTLIVIYTVGALFSYGQAFIMGSVAARLSKLMRTRISEKINRLPLKYFDRISYGDVLSRVTNDVDTIGQTLNMSLGQLISSVALFSGSLIMMIITNGTLAATAVLSTLLGFILMMVIVGKSQKFFKGQQRELGRIHDRHKERDSQHCV